MTRHSSMQILMIIALVCVLGMNGGCAKQDEAPGTQAVQSLPDETPVAQVGDQVITGAQLRQRYVREIGPSRGTLLPDKKATTLAEVAELLVREKVMALDARAQGLLDDPDISWNLEKTRRSILINAFVEKVVRPEVKVTDEQIDAQLAKSPKMTREQTEGKLLNDLIKANLNTRIKGLLETMHLEKNKSHIATAALLYAKLLRKPEMARSKNMSWVLKGQMLTEITPEQAALELVKFDGGAVTFLDLLKTIHGMVPVKRPKNLVTSEGIEAMVDASLGGALLATHIESLGLQKDPKTAQEIREREDQRLMGLAMGRKTKPIKQPSKDEIQARLNEIKEQLTPEHGVKIKTIWCEDRDTAEKAKLALGQGLMFDQVIEEMSLDPKNTRIGHATASSETVFWGQIWRTEPNQVVGPLQGFYRGDLKWRVVSVLEKVPGSDVSLDRRVEESIQSEIYAQRKKAILKPYQDELLQKYDHNIFEFRLSAFNPLVNEDVGTGALK